ncbi:SDR family oxidoreductase [Litchfieldia alkalitelluris]|uniref:SDR family oxidoreductase n=1 Tax=Litchfieldia alkalitelluris TaxID=304268 RepID=UPI000996F3B9|nr:SDR family oxidoreductase [Litchfieldia alkalitelluris]
MTNQKVIMITGASKGLGRALTLAFAEKGYSLAICARGLEKLLQVKKEALEKGAQEVLAIQADGAKEEDVDRFISITESAFGKIDVLIVNASIFGPGPTLLSDYPVNELKQVLDVNILHPFLTIRRVLPGMIVNQSGKIFAITSEAGKTGFATWGAYGISKFAVEGLIQTWSDELEGTNISISLIDPGEMDTEMHHIAVPDCDYELSAPEEVAKVIRFLASSDAQFIHGQRIQAQQFQGGETI